MAEFLFEIFCEEIPARMQKRAGDDLRKLLTAGFGKAGLAIDKAHHWAGPRRLGFTADIPLKSPDISDERKGPRVGALTFLKPKSVKIKRASFTSPK